MDGFTAENYGSSRAFNYDDPGQAPADVPEAVEFLAELSDGGKILEFGAGTGRITIPLAERGLSVSGIELSRAMADKLREKPNADRVTLFEGDLASLYVGNGYDLVFSAFNTLSHLTSQDQQVRAFQNAASHLRTGGAFVIQQSVPQSSEQDRWSVRPFDISLDSLEVDFTHHDPVSQSLTTQSVVITESGIKLFPLVKRYIWPSELDLMARLAGLTLEARWANWRRDAFTADSKSHISVYRLADATAPPPSCHIS